MNKKVFSAASILFCLILPLFMAAPLKGSYTPSTGHFNADSKTGAIGTVLTQLSSYPANSMWIEPSAVGIDFTIGTKFNVTVWLNTSQSCYVWQVALRFNPEYLNALRVDYTGLGKSQFFTGHITVGVTPAINNTEGILYLCESLVGSDPGVAGSGSLFWLEFQVVAPTVETTLYFDPDLTNGSFILDPALNDIQFTRYNAAVVNTGGVSHPPNSVWIDPSNFNITFTTGTKFNVTVWIDVNQPSFCWQVRVLFDTVYLNASRVGFTAGLTSDFYRGHTSLLAGPNIDNVQGWVWLGESLFAGDERPAGSGSLYWIEFQVVAPTNETAIRVDNSDATTIWDPDFNVIGPFSYYAAIVRNGPTPPLPPPTTVYVNPATSTVGMNRPFTIDININRTSDLYNWEFKLYYPNALLNFTNAAEGNFLRSGGSTVWVDSSNPNFNATHGVVYVGASLMGLIPGVTGNGTLASVSFTALTLDNSTLNLSDVVLLDSQLNEMPCVAADGSVVIGKENLVVSSVTPNKNVLSQNYTVGITVTVENQGASSQSFNVTLYANTSMVGMQQVSSLPPNGSYTFALNWTAVGVWNVSGFVFGNYTLRAVADDVPGEVNYDDNTLVNGTICVVIPGNINADGKVDMKDIGSICRLFGLRRGDTLFSTTCDLNNDGKIDMMDIGIVCRNFGQHYP